jgi:hypothetical protein
MLPRACDALEIFSILGVRRRRRAWFWSPSSARRPQIPVGPRALRGYLAPFCLSILSYTLGFMSSNSSARRPIGRGFALFCLADGPNEIAGATR